MPHKQIRRVREGLQERKAKVQERREKKGSLAQRAKRDVSRAVDRVERRIIPAEEEAIKTTREAKKLGAELAGPVRGAGEGARRLQASVSDTGSRIQEATARIDDEFQNQVTDLDVLDAARTDQEAMDMLGDTDHDGDLDFDVLPEGDGREFDGFVKDKSHDLDFEDDDFDLMGGR